MAGGGTKLEVTVEKLVYGGEGLSRVDGRVVFTRLVLPQERVLVEVEHERPGMVWARPVEILAPAPERVPAPCPYFGRCGGCHYQHATYDYQLAAKRSILAEALRRIGKIDAPDDIAIVAGEPWEYRNRAQFHLNGTDIGYLEAGSHKLCPVEACPISSPRINRTLARLRTMVRDRRWPRFVRSIEVFTNESEVLLHVVETDRPVAQRFFDWCAEEIPGYAPVALDYPAAARLYRVSRASFFQVNRCLVDRLVEVALDGAGGGRAADVYAGVGLFSIPLAAHFGEVVAVESGSSTVRDLRFNVERAAANVSVVQGSAEDYLLGLSSAPDFVLLDPPRAGMGKRVVERLADLKPGRITIVACDPTTLARDLAGLLAAGYALEKLTLVDLFPQTYHIETVAALRA